MGCSSPINVNQLVNKMYDIAKRPKKLKYIEKQQGDVDITFSNTEKAKKILKYNPKIKIDEGLRIAYEWQKEFVKI